MEEKPELIVFSQNLLGGGASFHKNMLANMPRDFFDIKCIYLNPEYWDGTKLIDKKFNADEILFSYSNAESDYTLGKRLSKLIAKREGVIVANLETEMVSLDLFPKRMKTTFFICHDDGYIPLALKYQSIIDVFIAHNYAVYEELKERINSKNIYFIQHGVNVVKIDKQINYHQKLKLVFLARHYEYKGIYDLPKINQILLKKGIEVDWLILGDGPERNKFISEVENLRNFKFSTPESSVVLMGLLQEQDVYILPSRKEGLPVSLLEAMSVGCVPLIAEFNTGINRVVTDDIGYVVNVGDNGSFANAIETLNGNRQLLAEKSVNCIKKVSTEFDIKKQALEYYKLYRNYKSLRTSHTIKRADVFRILSYFHTYKKIDFIIRNFKRLLLAKLS